MGALSASRCSHTARLALEKDGSVPKLTRLDPCSHRHMTLLFLLHPEAPVRNSNLFFDRSRDLDRSPHTRAQCGPIVHGGLRLNPML